MPVNRIRISVAGETNAGGRIDMEDFIAVSVSPNQTLSVSDIPELRQQAFVGVFDGHGGMEAAHYARNHLWNVIQAQPGFKSTNVTTVCQAIAKAYQQLHNDMLSYRASWKCTKTGDPSTAGTTACTVILRRKHIFVANVGDTTAVMGIKNSRYRQLGEPATLAKVLTVDHKPEDPREQERVKSLGGKVMSSHGVMRVVWERERKASPNSEQKVVDLIPLLNMSRSLGDFWSYNRSTQKFVVSPTPDVHVYPMDLSTQKFVVVASDGLWNVMAPQEVVDFIYKKKVTDCNQPQGIVSAIIKEALERWNSKRRIADNVSVVIVFLNVEDVPESSSVTSWESSKAVGIIIESQIKTRLHQKNRTLAKRLVSKGKAVCTPGQSRTLENGATPPISVLSSRQKEFNMFGSDNGPKVTESSPVPIDEAERTLSPLAKRQHFNITEDSVDEKLCRRSD